MHPYWRDRYKIWVNQRVFNPQEEENPHLSRRTDKKQLELLMDSRVQHFLGQFLNGQLSKIIPTFNDESGYAYPAVESLVGNHDDVEPFLESLVNHGLLIPSITGMLACCTTCGSSKLSSDKQINSITCERCGTKMESGYKLMPIYSYTFSEEGVREASDQLLVKPLYDFLLERGYRTLIPGTISGDSEVKHTFDVIAYTGNRDDSFLVIDFAISIKPVEETKVIAMFAKVYDTTPQRSIIVAVPRLTDDARKLAEQYSIDIVETDGASEIWRKLRTVIPPVDEFKFEALDVMTLLSLPDHLRKTATVTSKLGRATADQISEDTNRARAVESGYLNQLVRMGYLKKERDGRKVLFSVVS